MLNTAIVENSTKSADRLIKFLDRFSEEHGEEIRYTWYQGTHTFLSEYHFQFDLVFMDKMCIRDRVCTGSYSNRCK